MSRRSVGSAVIAIGVIVVAVAALADPIGIGGSDKFGWKQIVGVVVGVAVIAFVFITATLGEKPAPGFGTEE